ncbi:MAG: Ig-like domain-containing protein [Ruminococcus sp.]|nr:Ig-like domain-containing protein [Ruminococcus sp.]
MKKFFGILFSLTLSAFSIFNSMAFTAYADITRGLSEEEILNSSVKPVITVTKKVLKPDEITYPCEVTISVFVNGADGKYASTGIHLFYDKRLSPKRNNNGKIALVKGKGAQYLNMMFDEDNTRISEGMNGIFAATSADDNDGMDGEFFSFDATLPEDAEKGDVFPIDIVYMEYEYATDVFIDVYKRNIPMQAYLFTRGIYNADNPVSNSWEYANDVKKCAALADIDTSCDGYIAVADYNFDDSPLPSLVPTEITMKSGDKNNIIVLNSGAKEIRWTSSNTTAAVVENGTVTAVNPGTAVIYAVCGDYVMQCTVNVISGEYLAGDANLDEKVTISDAVRILQYVSNSEKYPLSRQAAENADVFGNSDGVTARDALSVQKYDAGIIDSLPEKQ